MRVRPLKDIRAHVDKYLQPRRVLHPDAAGALRRAVRQVETGTRPGPHVGRDPHQKGV